MAKRGLYANINAKRKRIADGSGEKMRKVGSAGAPSLVLERVTSLRKNHGQKGTLCKH